MQATSKIEERINRNQDKNSNTYKKPIVNDKKSRLMYGVEQEIKESIISDITGIPNPIELDIRLTQRIDNQ